MRRLQSLLTLLLGLAVFIGLGWASTRFVLQQDWTAQQRNSLSPELVRIIHALQAPLTITAIVKNDPALKRRIIEAILPLQQASPEIHLQFEDLITRAGKEAARQNLSGRLILDYQGQQTTLTQLDETSLLRGLQELQQGGERWAVFLQGHGEKSLDDQTANGYFSLDALLHKRGYRTLALNLLALGSIPDNTAVLILAAPRHSLLPAELTAVQNYIDAGHPLLWLREPHAQDGLNTLAESLGLAFLPGIIISNNTEMRALLGIKHPAVIPIIDYGNSTLTRQLDGQTLLPVATAISPTGQPPWHVETLLRSLPDSWTETGDLKGHVAYDPEQGEFQGPFILGVALTRPTAKTTQRIAVIGDSDFLNNDYLGYGQNQAFAERLFDWLSSNTRLITTAHPVVEDTRLNYSENTLTWLAAVLLLGIPAIFLIIATLQWLRRRA